MTDTPASHMDDALAELALVARSGTSTTAAFEDAIRGVWEAAARTPPEKASAAISTLLPLLSITSAVRAGFVALCCGGLVERGAGPDIALGVVVSRLRGVLADAAAFAEAALKLAGPAESFGADADLAAMVDELGSQVAQDHPRLAWAWAATDLFGRASIAMLGRSKTGRQAARRDPELVGGLARLAGVQPVANWLSQLLAVLDDEDLLILHPGLGRGYRVRVSGLADNLQLHTLLAGALVGDPAQGWLPGQRPSAASLAAARGEAVAGDSPVVQAVFNLVEWRALDAAGRLPAGGDNAHWIWGEGAPGDIEPFEGLRVILLGDPPNARSWPAEARFPGLAAEFTVLEQLDTAAVRAWLKRLAAAGQAPR